MNHQPSGSQSHTFTTRLQPAWMCCVVFLPSEGAQRLPGLSSYLTPGCIRVPPNARQFAARVPFPHRLLLQGDLFIINHVEGMGAPVICFGIRRNQMELETCYSPIPPSTRAYGSEVKLMRKPAGSCEGVLWMWDLSLSEPFSTPRPAKISPGMGSADVASL